jgi:hypothetical protein
MHLHIIKIKLKNNIFILLKKHKMEKDFVELYSLKDLAAAENHHPLTIRK